MMLRKAVFGFIVLAAVAASEAESGAVVADDYDDEKDDVKVVIVKVPTGEEITHSKVMLVIVELLGLGAFGVDRCCMGDTCTGFLKLITAGGVGIWALADFVSIIVNALMADNNLPNLFENDGTWNGAGDIRTAQIIVGIGLIPLLLGVAWRTYVYFTKSSVPRMN